MARTKQTARKSTGGRPPQARMVNNLDDSRTPSSSPSPERPITYMDRATPGPTLTSDEEDGGGMGKEKRRGAIETGSSQRMTDQRPGGGAIGAETIREDAQMMAGGSSESTQEGAGNSGITNQQVTLDDRVQSVEERIKKVRNDVDELSKDIKELEEKLEEPK